MFSRINWASRTLVAAAFVVSCVSQMSRGFPLPQQSAIDLNGKPIDLFKVSQGKIIVLIFVRTDCPVSNRYAPLLQRMSDTYASSVRFWLVYPDRKTTPQEIRNHLEQFHYKISALRDPDHSLVKLAKATITPEAAVFDSQGRLFYHGRIDNWYEDASRVRPAATMHELQNAVGAAIGGKPSPVATASAVGCYISDLE